MRSAEGVIDPYRSGGIDRKLTDNAGARGEAGAEELRRGEQRHGGE